MKKEKRTFGKILMVLMILFFYLPIIYMIVFSFNDSKSLTGFTGFSVGLDMLRLPLLFIPWLAIILAGYLLCVQLVKKVYVRRYGEWM